MIRTPRSLVSRFYSSTTKKSCPGTARVTTAANPVIEKISSTVENPIPLHPRPQNDPSLVVTNLDSPFPGIGEAVYAPIKESTLHYYDTQLTRLDNGLRVASQPRFGKYSTIGVAISTGCRFEKGFTSGTAQFIEKLGFSPSKNYESRQKIIKTLEEYGGICDSQCSRDTTVYAISAERKGIDKMLKLLAETILYPVIDQDMISEIRQAIIYEQEDMELRPEQEMTLTELIHRAAWGNQTLGLTRYCPQENVGSIRRDDLLRFMQTYFTPTNIVLAGVGVDHNEIVDLSKEYFNFPKSTWNTEDFQGKDKPIPRDTSTAQYTGGMVKVEKDFGTFNSGPQPVPVLAHLAIGLESVPFNHPDFIATCVLNILMGGGGSFSAGGPGKGMYSRLYRNLLNQYGWANSATAYNSSYVDSGIFTIYGSSPPNYLKNLVHVFVKQLVDMAGGVENEELQRSKTQLHSMLLMNLESRPIVFEDIGRQILSHGVYKPPDEYIKEIENVTAEDIERVASRLLNSKPSVAALGNLSNLPSYEAIESSLKDIRANNLSRQTAGRFNFFKS